MGDEEAGGGFELELHTVHDGGEEAELAGLQGEGMLGVEHTDCAGHDAEDAGGAEGVIEMSTRGGGDGFDFEERIIRQSLEVDGGGV